MRTRTTSDPGSKFESRFEKEFGNINQTRHDEQSTRACTLWSGVQQKPPSTFSDPKNGGIFPASFSNFVFISLYNFSDFLLDFDLESSMAKSSSKAKRSPASSPAMGIGKGKVTPIQIAFIVERFLADNNYEVPPSDPRPQISSPRPRAKRLLTSNSNIQIELKFFIRFLILVV